MTAGKARVSCGDRTLECTFSVHLADSGEPRLIELLDAPADFACDQYVQVELPNGRILNGLMLADTKICYVISGSRYPPTIAGPG
jgi:hypothetical protein